MLRGTQHRTLRFIYDYSSLTEKQQYILETYFNFFYEKTRKKRKSEGGKKMYGEGHRAEFIVIFLKTKFQLDEMINKNTY